MSKKIKLTRKEQETIIRTSAVDSEWDVCTAGPRIIRYSKRQGYNPVPDHQFSTHMSCKVPFNKVRVRKHEIKVSAKQRAGLTKRMKINVVKQAFAQNKNEKTSSTLTPVF